MRALTGKKPRTASETEKPNLAAIYFAMFFASGTESTGSRGPRIRTMFLSARKLVIPQDNPAKFVATLVAAVVVPTPPLFNAIATIFPRFLGGAESASISCSTAPKMLRNSSPINTWRLPSRSATYLHSSRFFLTQSGPQRDREIHRRFEGISFSLGATVKFLSLCCHLSPGVGGVEPRSLLKQRRLIQTWRWSSRNI
jgi:hypothetical protein